jgi:hypothetical protein
MTRDACAVETEPGSPTWVIVSPSKATSAERAGAPEPSTSEALVMTVVRASAMQEIYLSV